MDTSVWVDHLHRGVPRLATALRDVVVWTHPYVIGEMACGNLRKRDEVLGLLGRLPRVPAASDAEALGVIERWRLMGRGIGYLDVHLLASTALAAPARLWTRDRRLASIAADLGLAFTE